MRQWIDLGKMLVEAEGRPTYLVIQSKSDGDIIFALAKDERYAQELGGKISEHGRNPWGIVKPGTNAYKVIRARYPSLEPLIPEDEPNQGFQQDLETGDGETDWIDVEQWVTDHSHSLLPFEFNPEDVKLLCAIYLDVSEGRNGIEASILYDITREMSKGLKENLLTKEIADVYFRTVYNVGSEDKERLATQMGSWPASQDLALGIFKNLYPMHYAWLEKKMHLR